MTDSPSQTRLLADVLREAANVWLAAPDEVETEIGALQGKQEFSCHAVYRAAYGESWRDRHSTARSDHFLMTLGCDPISSMFMGSEAVEFKQSVRHLWLLLAACVAEDEGITL